MKSSSLSRVLIPLVLVITFTIINHYIASFMLSINFSLDSNITVVVSNFFSTLLYLSISLFFIRFSNIFIFECIIEKKLQVNIPHLLIEIYNAFIFLGFIIAILNQVFFVPLTGLLTATSAIGVVLGFALKDILSDIFAGIALNIEQPFKIGDDIELDNGVMGTVKDITWRATYIQEATRMITIVPNAKMNAMQMKNYHYQSKYYQVRLSFHLNHNVPTTRAMRIVNAALKDENLGINNEMSDVHVIGIDELGVEYGLRFFVSDILSEYPIRSNLLCSIMDNLYQSGLTPAYPNRDVFFTQMPEKVLSNEARKEFVISRLELFETLSSSEKSLLIKTLSAKKYTVGDTIVRQGEEGSSLFILVEGLLGVMITDNETQQDFKVAKLQAGNSFGEFSLLTGDNRSATVVAEHDCIVYEIEKKDFAPILENNTELASYLSLILAKRQLSSKQKMDSSNFKDEKNEINKAGENILNKMSKIFNFLKK